MLREILVMIFAEEVVRKQRRRKGFRIAYPSGSGKKTQLTCEPAAGFEVICRPVWGRLSVVP